MTPKTLVLFSRAGYAKIAVRGDGGNNDSCRFSLEATTNEAVMGSESCSPRPWSMWEVACNEVTALGQKVPVWQISVQ